MVCNDSYYVLYTVHHRVSNVRIRVPSSILWRFIEFLGVHHRTLNKEETRVQVYTEVQLILNKMRLLLRVNKRFANAILR